MWCRKKNVKQVRKLWVAAGVWLSALAICATLVVAEDAEVSAEPTAVAATTAAPAEEEVVQPVMNGQSIQTISFKKDMPIKDALRMLAQMYQKNIVPSAKVDGIVTVSYLYDVTFEEALQAILGTHKYEAKGNFIKVYTNEEFMADKSRFEDAMIELFYINAEEAKKLATPLLSEFGQIGVTSPAQLDTTPGRGGDSLALRDRLTLSDYPENIAKIRQMLADVDIAPPQVLIEVTILEATLNETTKFGIDFRNLNLDLGVEGLLGLGDSGVTNTSPSTFNADGGMRVGIVNDKVDVLITALDSVTDTTILANPKILALNKQAGKIIIGRQDGYRTLTNLSDGGNQTQQVEFLESGTVLEFRPFIGKDGLIRMELRPEQSAGVIENDLPNKRTTEVLTNIMVRDGKTIVLGGLFQEKTTLGRSQVPVLGDLPFIGSLFRSTNDNSERVELIVLLTPHIINEPEQADGADRLADAQRLAYEARQNLSWLHRAKLDEDRYARAVKLYQDGDLDGAMAELNSPFNIQRNYLDETRLRERIIRQQQPADVNKIERIMLGNLEKEESGKWYRR